MSAQLQLAARPASRRLGALRHDNYRFFVSGQAISTIGTWMQSLAQSWLVLRLTHNPLAVGLVVAIQFVPMLVASRPGARAVERTSKRKVLLLTQGSFMVPAIALFLVAQAGLAQVWMVALAALIVGVVNVFDIPARQSFLVEMVGREDLVNAISLNSSVFNAAAVIGPLAAGFLIADFGVAACFLANAVSYLIAMLALWLMRNLPALTIKRRYREASDDDLHGGWLLLRDSHVTLLLVCVAAFSLFATNRLVLLPLFSDNVLRTGAFGFGLLVAMLGLGSLIGTIHLSISGAQATGQRQVLLAMIWVFALEFFTLSRSVWISSALLVVAGYCQICFLAISNSRIQTATPDHMRERVLSIYTQVLAGMSPIGSLVTALLV
ncbi:MAG TPA: MFS transporter, partial [Candidatus Dormibacteraeota bacterium]|nr:MFS transporter [Candidatus Dormibacteraeota bacterium]